MVTIVNTRFPKLCHAQVGDFVRLLDRATGDVLPEVYIVAAKPEKGRRPGRVNMTHGLYDDERELFLVSLNTGMAIPMPHLSSRADIDQADKNLPLNNGKVKVLREHSSRRVELTLMPSVSGRNPRTVTLDLGDEDAVLSLLEHLADSQEDLVSVQDAEAARVGRLMKDWRAAVSQGLTLQSFEEFARSLQAA